MEIGNVFDLTDTLKWVAPIVEEFCAENIIDRLRAIRALCPGLEKILVAPVFPRQVILVLESL